jgi:hypothetical protein
MGSSAARELAARRVQFARLQMVQFAWSWTVQSATSWTVRTGCMAPVPSLTAYLRDWAPSAFAPRQGRQLLGQRQEPFRSKAVS